MNILYELIVCFFYVKAFINYNNVVLHIFALSIDEYKVLLLTDGKKSLP